MTGRREADRPPTSIEEEGEDFFEEPTRPAGETAHASLTRSRGARLATGLLLLTLVAIILPFGLADPAAAGDFVAEHVHTRFGETADDCHEGPTETVAAIDTEVGVVFCIFEHIIFIGSGDEDPHMPVDSPPNTVEWGETPQGSSQFVSEEDNTDSDGVARAVITSPVPGVSTITACHDENMSNDCEEGEDRESVTVTWIAPHMHLAFDPTVENPDDCSAGPTAEEVAAGEPNVFVACVHDENNQPIEGAEVTPEIQSGPGTITPPTDTTDATGRATFTFESEETGESVITATGTAFGGAFVSENTITKTIVAAGLNHLHLAFAPPNDAPSGDDCSNGPNSDTHSVNNPNPFVGCAHDEFNNPIAGVTVTPTIESGVGAITPESALTDANGQAAFDVNSTETGESVITAAAQENGTIVHSNNTISKTWTTEDALLDDLHLAFSPPDPAQGHDCSNGPFEDTHTVNTPNPFVGCAHDEFGNPLSGVRVTPTVESGPGSIAPASALTDNSGRATFTHTSTQAGESVIDAVASKGPTTVSSENRITKTWEAGEADHLHLAWAPPTEDPHQCSAGPTEESHPVGTPNEFVACSQDEFDNPVAGVLVTPTVESGPGDITPESAITGPDGRATFTLESEQAGTSVVDASGQENSTVVFSENTITKQWQAGPGATITLEPATAENEAGEPHTVTATVFDEFDNPVPNALVTFTASGTGAEEPSSGSATTDSNGEATFTFTSAVTGTSTITATHGSASATATKTWTEAVTVDHAHVVFGDDASDCHTGPTTDSRPYGQTNMVIFCLHNVGHVGIDSGPNTVLWEETGTAGTFVSVENQTDASGVARATITSDAPGEQNVDACFDSQPDGICDGPATRGNVDQTWTPALKHLHLAFTPTTPDDDDCSAGPVTDTHTVGEPNEFVGCAHDDFNNPVEGATVTPTVEAGVGTITPTSTATDASGRATFTLESTVPGESVVSATATDGFTFVHALNRVTKTWEAGPLEHLYLAFVPTNPSSDDCSEGPTSKTDTVGNPNPFVGCAHDEFHNPLAEVRVTPTKTSGPGSFTPAAATTDSNGRATFTLTSTTQGQTVIDAIASDGEVTVSAESQIVKTWEPQCTAPNNSGWMAYDIGFGGGVFVATGDVDGDGCDEVITGAGQGGGPHVRVFRGSGTLIAQGFVYNSGFTGGVRVGAGDVDGDGRDEVITGAGPGGGPHVQAFDVVGSSLSLRASFFAYDPAFTGGVFVAGGDITGSSRDEIITGAGEGGGPHVKLFTGSGGFLSGVMAYNINFTGGARVGSSNVDGGSKAEILTGAGPGGGPHAKVWDFVGSSFVQQSSFMAYDIGFAGGIFVGGGNVIGGSSGEVITGADAGGGPHVKVFNGGGGVLASFFAYSSGFAGGVRVAGGDADNDGNGEVVTGAGPGGGPHVRLFE
jgi:protocatechuate 3,4-dioxygenase beta subunit